MKKTDTTEITDIKLHINAVVYVSPIIDNKDGDYKINWVEFEDTNLVMREARLDSLLEADNVIKALKRIRKDI